MKGNLLVLALLAIGYVSCKNTSDVPPPPSPPDSYFPQTNGSSWIYRDSTNEEKTDTVQVYGVKIDTVTFTMNGMTTDFNGRICYNAVISSKLNGDGIAYFYNKNRVSGLFESAPPYGFTYFEFLIDSNLVGYQWSSTPGLNTLLNGKLVRSTNTILEKNINKVVNGITYPNVIHTSCNFQIIDNGAVFQNIAHYDFYLAKGFGLLEKDAHVYGVSNETETILHYNVK